MKITSRLMAVGAVFALSAATAFGHHSFAMFDQTKKVIITGTVAEVQWTNPHIWVYLDVPGDNGASERWGVEFTSVVHMTRLGMRYDTIKVGDVVEFTISPYADGSPGGRFYTARLPNGELVCDVGAQQVCRQNN